ncbi:hypothetical protein ACLOJK_037126, partial [Asimina triloba]
MCWYTKQRFIFFANDCPHVDLPSADSKPATVCDHGSSSMLHASNEQQPTTHLRRRAADDPSTTAAAVVRHSVRRPPSSINTRSCSHERPIQGSASPSSSRLHRTHHHGRSSPSTASNKPAAVHHTASRAVQTHHARTIPHLDGHHQPPSTKPIYLFVRSAKIRWPRSIRAASNGALGGSIQGKQKMLGEASIQRVRDVEEAERHTESLGRLAREASKIGRQGR